MNTDHDADTTATCSRNEREVNPMRGLTSLATTRTVCPSTLSQPFRADVVETWVREKSETSILRTQSMGSDPLRER